MIRAAIAGGTGYTGGELFRILLRHPDVEITAATTTSSDGVPVYEVHRDLVGETELKFGKELGKPDDLSLRIVNFRSGVDRNSAMMKTILEKYPVIRQRLEKGK